MRISRRIRLRVQNLLRLLLLGVAIGLAAWLSTRYTVQLDWSAGERNTLSPASLELLTRLPGPVQVTAFVRDNPSLRNRIQTLLGRYQRYKPDMALSFVNPDAVPEQIRRFGITRDGELYVQYQGQGERLQQLTESGLSHALQRLRRAQERVVLFLAGHGERKPQGQANHDLGIFGRRLERTGVKVQELNLAKQPYIPKGAAVLVIASPQVALLSGEVQLILDYVEQGGNLLWLMEPDGAMGLERLAEALGVEWLPGVVVDADAPAFGIDNPAFALVADYPTHPVTKELQGLTLFPVAVGLTLRSLPKWEAQQLLATQPRTWNEVGSLRNAVRFDADRGERLGPLTLGVTLTRRRPARDDASQQRIVTIGDGDFLSNAYLGNGSNLNLGLNLMNWLSQDDMLLAIHIQEAPDQTLHLTNAALLVIGSSFLLILPALLLASGWLLWWRRQRR